MDEILHLEAQTIDGSTLITLVGEVDAASILALQESLDDVPLDRHVLIDMSAVRFMDSTGLKVILEQRMLMVENGGSIHIQNPSPAVQLLVDVTGLDHILYRPDNHARVQRFR